jgi:magnesium-transporting ATPase (P-type)
MALFMSVQHWSQKMTNPVVLFASALITSLPIIVIAVVGVVLSRNKLPQAHARARRLATVGFSLLALQALVGTTMRMYVSYLAVESGDRLAMANYLTLVGVVASLLLWASLILLLLAVFADRNASGSSPAAR